MLSPVQAAHRFIGSPEVETCGPVKGYHRCWQCGGPVLRGMHTEAWAKGSYTSQPRARAPVSEWICEACVHICSRTAVPGRVPKDGQKENRPPTWRQFSAADADRGQGGGAVQLSPF